MQSLVKRGLLQLFLDGYWQRIKALCQTIKLHAKPIIVKSKKLLQLFYMDIGGE